MRGVAKRPNKSAYTFYIKIENVLKVKLNVFNGCGGCSCGWTCGPCDPCG
jgi:hypothetical protein